MSNPCACGKVLNALGHAPIAKPEDVLRGVLGGKKYNLMQGGMLRRAQGLGRTTHRAEKARPSSAACFREWGAYTETIGGRERWFVPTGESARFQY